jgi:hypothetical protein
VNLLGQKEEKGRRGEEETATFTSGFAGFPPHLLCLLFSLSFVIRLGGKNLPLALFTPLKQNKEKEFWR